MNSSALLPLLLLTPLIGALVCTVMPVGKPVRRWALGVSLVTLGVALLMAAGFNFRQDLGPVGNEARLKQLQQSVQLSWGMERGREDSLSIEQFGFHLALGVDSISFWLVLLTALLTPLAIGASFESIRERQKEYYAWMLLLLAAMLGVFVSRDLLLFYIFF